MFFLDLVSILTLSLLMTCDSLIVKIHKKNDFKFNQAGFKECNLNYTLYTKLDLDLYYKRKIIRHLEKQTCDTNKQIKAQILICFVLVDMVIVTIHIFASYVTSHPNPQSTPNSSDALFGWFSKLKDSTNKSYNTQN